VWFSIIDCIVQMCTVALAEFFPPHNSKPWPANGTTIPLCGLPVMTRSRIVLRRIVWAIRLENLRNPERIHFLISWNKITSKPEVRAYAQSAGPYLGVNGDIKYILRKACDCQKKATIHNPTVFGAQTFILEGGKPICSRLRWSVVNQRHD
jgi:hypothetical protein